MSETQNTDEVIRKLEDRDRADEVRFQPVLSQAQEKIRTIVGNQPQISKEDTGFRVDRFDLTSTYFQSGAFALWAGILRPQTFPSLMGEEFAGVIKNLRIPENLRRSGLGKQIVQTWESTLSAHGIKSFLATNIKDEEAIQFWRKQGYDVPEDEKYKKNPYYMVKKID